MKAFHEHLDVCGQCREQPFNLCAEGARLLEAAARRIDVGIRDAFEELADDGDHEPGYGHGV